jgi:hypothetical protein
MISNDKVDPLICIYAILLSFVIHFALWIIVIFNFGYMEQSGKIAFVILVLFDMTDFMVATAQTFKRIEKGESNE